MTKEEQADLEVWRAHRVTFEAELAELEQLLEDGCNDMEPAEIEQEIRTYRQAIQVIDAPFGLSGTNHRVIGNITNL